MRREKKGERKERARLIIAGASAVAVLGYAILPNSAHTAEMPKSVDHFHELWSHYQPDKALSAAPKGHYTLDPTHAFLSFKISHLGGLSSPIMRFNNVKAEYDWDPQNPTATKVKARVLPTSLDSNNYDFDARLNSESQGLRGVDSADGLMDGKYRWITFESTALKFNGSKATMTGNLTLYGNTRPITLDVTYNGYLKYNNWPKMGFSAVGAFKRSDFGFIAKPSAGDDISVMLEMEFVRVEPATQKYLENELGGPGGSADIGH